MKSLVLAYIVSVIGFFGMLLFPNPEENFLFYFCFAFIVSVITVILLRKDALKREVKLKMGLLGIFGIIGVIVYHALVGQREK